MLPEPRSSGAELFLLALDVPAELVMSMPLIPAMSSPARELAWAPEGARQVTPAPARTSCRERAKETRTAKSRFRIMDLADPTDTARTSISSRLDPSWSVRRTGAFAQPGLRRHIVGRPVTAAITEQQMSPERRWRSTIRAGVLVSDARCHRGLCRRRPHACARFGCLALVSGWHALRCRRTRQRRHP